MQTEAVLKDSDATKTSATDKDPKLLGVSLPVSTTVEAAIQVKKAWADALTQVLAAAKARSAAAKNKAQTTASNGAAEINA